MALASLLAQTYEDWECVLVDDGSTDHPERVVEAAADPRIRYIRLERNMGGGFARQVTLEEARGELIAFLDADDWMYPWRLARQVEVMLAHPDLAVLSSGMAIVDAEGHLVGTRGSAPGETIYFARLRQLAPPPLAFAPSILRRGAALKAGFDESFRVVQDADFLLRILLKERYGILPEILYVYTEYQTVTLSKILRQGSFVRRMFWKHRTSFPAASVLRIGESFVKSGVHLLAFATGQKDRLIRRRSRTPTEVQQMEFESARSAVLRAGEAVFGAEVLGMNQGQIMAAG